MRARIFGGAGGGRSLFFYYLLSFTSELPDITKKIDILAQKPPVFGDIQTYKYNLVTTGP